MMMDFDGNKLAHSQSKKVSSPNNQFIRSNQESLESIQQQTESAIDYDEDDDSVEDDQDLTMIDGAMEEIMIQDRIDQDDLETLRQKMED